MAGSTVGSGAPAGDCRRCSCHAVGDVVLAARDGRVDVLFVAIGIRIWGTLAAESRTVEAAAEQMNGTDDLLSLAAIHTILNRGTVYPVAPTDMPDHGALAAVFRF
jgi:hypothetical protein